MQPLIEALLLQSGYNAALVAIGAALFGTAAGSAGCFLFLRKRALVSDATAHATLPGICLAFIIMVAFGLDGRNLLGLLSGSAITAVLGLLIVSWITRRTRLAEDAAIGAVLSVFFGFGIVLLTVIQSMSSGRQAGLEGFLLGSTAGMLYVDAVLIAAAAALVLLVLIAFRRPMSIVAFDHEYASAIGVPVGRIDFLMMALVTTVTVIGLKLIGLILVIALLIIPPVTARFWTERTDNVLIFGGLIGGLSGFIGAAVSATAPNLPTGPIIVLVCFAFFITSLLISPFRGVLAAFIRHRRFQLQVHRRQGLLALAHSEPIHDALTLTVLKRGGLIQADGVATESGRAQSAKARLDEQRWAIARRLYTDDAISSRYDGLTPIETLLTPDEIAALDSHIRPPKAVTA